MEDGMMCVVNPAACHIQFCTFRHATIILQHVGASIITNCEFSQSDNANIVVEGGCKDSLQVVGVSGGQCWVTVILRHGQGGEGWADPHLCQQRDGEGCFLVFCTCHVVS